MRRFIAALVRRFISAPYPCSRKGASTAPMNRLTRAPINWRTPHGFYFALSLKTVTEYGAKAYVSPARRVDFGRGRGAIFFGSSSVL